MVDYRISLAAGAVGALSLMACSSDTGTGNDFGAGSGGVGNVGTGASSATGGVVGVTGGATGSGGLAATGGGSGTGGAASGGAGTGGAATGGAEGTGGATNTDCTSTAADEKFSFFVTSWHHIRELSGSDDGFGGDLRYNGASTGLEGADAICQEIASRVCFGHKTWKAYLSTSQVDAIDRIGTGPWYDHGGNLVANDTAGLVQGNRPAGGANDSGTYDETGLYHDGKTDQNGDGEDDDDHDTLTGSTSDGVYAGFSCEDWTSTTATGPGGGGFPGGGSSGPMCGHSWPANSGQGWSQAHSARGCAAGVNFIQDGPGMGNSVGASGGYGGFYCFAL